MATGDVRGHEVGRQGNEPRAKARVHDDRAAYEAWLARREEANVQTARARAEAEQEPTIEEELGRKARRETQRGQAAEPAEAPTSSRPRSGRWAVRLVERWAERIGKRHLLRLAQERGHLALALGDVPSKMRKVAQQTHLALELLDDFRSGEYRDLSWRAAALLSAAVLYVVSPLDVVPDLLPALGHLDEVAILTVAVRLVEKDLRRYCRFKGRPEADYF